MSAYLVVLVILWVFAPPPLQTEEPEVVEITSPVPGQAIQGILPIFGTVRTNRGFISGRLAFSYELDDRGSWFEISPVPRLVEESELGIWDTTSLTDGNYALRLEVSLASGEVITHTVSGLRVRNYSMIETDTPAPTQTLPAGPGPTSVPPSAPTPTRRPPTPTLLPPNPAEITVSQLSGSAGRGVLITLAVFAALGFLVLRRRFKP